MTLTPSQTGFATRRGSFVLCAVLLFSSVFILNLVCFAQAENLAPVATKPVSAKTTTADERAELLKLIRSLQERVEKLEAAQPSATNTPAVPVVEPTSSADVQPANIPEPVATAASNKGDDDDDDDGRSYGRYTPTRLAAHFTRSDENRESPSLELAF
jgi:hypothetical protein